MGRTNLTSGLRWLPCLWLMLCGCELGSADAEAGFSTKPQGPDVMLPDIRSDIFLEDSLIPPTDIGPVDDTAVVDSLETKLDPTYLVPPTLSQKAHMAVAVGRAAWVEKVSAGSVPDLVLWNHALDEKPTRLAIPYTLDPSRIHLGDAWVFYVDTIWGDEDIFGFRPSDGAWKLIAGGPGAQVLHSEKNGRILYTDCSGCVPGTESAAASEVYELNAAEGGLPVRLSNNDVHDSSPVFGTTADGEAAIAWVSNYSDLVVRVGENQSTTKTEALLIQDIALISGRIAWRPSPAIINPDSMIPSPMIINPDSMIPSDVNLTDIVSGTTTPLTQHAELGANTPTSLRATDTHVAFAEGIMNSDRERIRVIDMASGAVEVVLVEEPELTHFALGTGVLGFVAPRADNEGLDDAWLLMF
jgi:hypothetical protein